MHEHADHGADYPNNADYTNSETRETPKNAADLANEALDAVGGDHGVAVSMLRNAVDHVIAGEL